MFRAADEKIPPSVVEVNNKPQEGVFSSHSRRPFAKPLQLPVESAKSPSQRSFPPPPLSRIRCNCLRVCRRARYSLEATPTPVWAQGAKTVHLRLLIVEMWRSRDKYRLQIGLQLKKRPRRNHLLVQYARNQDLVCLMQIEDRMFSVLETPQPWDQIVAASPHGWMVSEVQKDALQAGCIKHRLIRTPLLDGIAGNLPKILARHPGNTKPRQGSGPFAPRLPIHLCR